MPDAVAVPGMGRGAVADGMLAEWLVLRMMLAPECVAADGRPRCGTCGGNENLVLRRTPEVRPAGTSGTCGICRRRSSGLLCSSPDAWFTCRGCLGCS
jgi:hypothetical protein